MGQVVWVDVLQHNGSSGMGKYFNTMGNVAWAEINSRLTSYHESIALYIRASGQFRPISIEQAYGADQSECFYMH